MKAVIKLGRSSVNLFFKRVFPRSAMDFSVEHTIDPELRAEEIDRLRRIGEFIPKLTSTLHKGQCGRIGVLGGSSEYSGAPYFAAISSLKLGADLAYVFCCKEAAPIIKCYSPDLIVLPILDSIDAVKKIESWLVRLHVLVIGPGLGREPGLLKNVSDIITYCKEKMSPSLPLVIDADGLFLLAEDPNIIKNYKGPVILTPNVIEFNRIAHKMSESNALKLAAALNAVIVQKGAKDIIVNGIQNSEYKMGQDLVMLTCDAKGSRRRCGGQGDILSGCIATFIAWLEIYFKYNTNFDFNVIQRKDSKMQKIDLFANTIMKYSLAAYGACLITRTCSRLAFEEHGRGMTASDMINFLQKAFQMHFEH